MKNDDIKTLTERFFDGETTLEEERRLYELYAKDDVTDEFLPCREMFSDLKAAAFKPEEKAETQRKPVRMRLFAKVLTGVAASIVLLFGAVTVWNIHQNNELAKLYGGSYMIVNGKRIDNLRTMKPEIERTLAAADKIEQHVTSNKEILNAEQSVLDNIDDPAERQRVAELLKE